MRFGVIGFRRLVLSILAFAILAGCAKQPTEEVVKIEPVQEKVEEPKPVGIDRPLRDGPDEYVEACFARIRRSAANLRPSLEAALMPTFQGKPLTLKMIRKHSIGIADFAKKVIEYDNATDLEKERAAMIVLTSLHEGARIVPEPLVEVHDEFVQRFLDSDPQGTVAAEGVGNCLERDYIAADKPLDMTLEVLCEYVEEFPDQPRGPALFEKLANRRLAAGSFDDAIRTYREGIRAHQGKEAIIKDLALKMSESKRQKHIAIGPNEEAARKMAMYVYASVVNNARC